ncbi:MAG TPA: ribosome maturation factor RimM, partial [Pyrinomonadaceae bacterium]|nr:ribosome maturation factor RimM [Pyrinomonadaceae bacterium]
MEDLVAIARIVKPRGLKGELVADLLTDFPERFEGVRRVTAVMPDGDLRELKIEKFWFQQGRVVLKFEDFGDPASADLLRKAEICIPESDAVELEDGEFFDWQLAGCKVETIDGESLGTVKELMRTGGTEILVVRGEEKEFLIP